ncbi:hypothetical protein ACIBHY_06810 [Nonomuraea sp. NPDC050547]|uniref:hypothetical protein n=1 Tax=unclassified Nonomuraea TaxID=2593643 RepID=UPI00347CEE68
MKRLAVALVAFAALLGLAAPAQAAPVRAAEVSAAALPTKCDNIGWGPSLVCIDINAGERWITVWYDRRDGVGRQWVHGLSYTGPDGNHQDEGGFSINPGELKGYRWYNVPTGSGGYVGFVRTDAGTDDTGTLWI